jgi:hypothetical protein
MNAEAADVRFKDDIHSVRVVKNWAEKMVQVMWLYPMCCALHFLQYDLICSHSSHHILAESSVWRESLSV